MLRNALIVLAALAIVVIWRPIDVTAQPVDRTWRLPTSAVAITDELFSLGTAIDPSSGRLVQGYAMLRFKELPARGQAARPSPGGSCYAFLASGAKWKTVEPWLMNPSNTRGLNGSTLFSTQVNAVAKWEDAADGTVGSGPGFDIMGPGANTTDALAADTSAPDNINEIYFGSIASPNVIAVTTVWGIFGGSPKNRELLEWDQVYDQVDYDWSLTGEAAKMDFDNIATHEDGHAVGLGHPSNTCSNETMYAFADFGEIMKRDLHTGDINGTSALY